MYLPDVFPGGGNVNLWHDLHIDEEQVGFIFQNPADHVGMQALICPQSWCLRRPQRRTAYELVGRCSVDVQSLYISSVIEPEPELS